MTKRRRETDEDKGRKITQLQNARIVCPAPLKASYRTAESAQSGAAAMGRKSDLPWRSYACLCGRFHLTADGDYA